jgi:hypothetical protein
VAIPQYAFSGSFVPSTSDYWLDGSGLIVTRTATAPWTTESFVLGAVDRWSLENNYLRFVQRPSAGDMWAPGFTYWPGKVSTQDVLVAGLANYPVPSGRLGVAFVRTAVTAYYPQTAPYVEGFKITDLRTPQTAISPLSMNGLVVNTSRGQTTVRVAYLKCRPGAYTPPAGWAGGKQPSGGI